MMECVIWYFDYYFENLSGSSSPVPRVLGVLVSASKRTVSRLLVLIVSLGYGVVK
jgi:GOST, seven transmembrane domain